MWYDKPVNEVTDAVGKGLVNVEVDMVPLLEQYLPGFLPHVGAPVPPIGNRPGSPQAPSVVEEWSLSPT